jgi:hypothetical protein
MAMVTTTTNSAHLPFDPDTADILGRAFDEAWEALRTLNPDVLHSAHGVQLRESIALCIIDAAKLGERDPERLRDHALAHLGKAVD